MEMAGVQLESFDISRRRTFDFSFTVSTTYSGRPSDVVSTRQSGFNTHPSSLLDSLEPDNYAFLTPTTDFLQNR